MRDLNNETMPYSLIVQPSETKDSYGVTVPALDTFGICSASGETVWEALTNTHKSVSEFIDVIRDMGLQPPPAEAEPKIFMIPPHLAGAAYEDFKLRVLARAS